MSSHTQMTALDETLKFDFEGTDLFCGFVDQTHLNKFLKFDSQGRASMTQRFKVPPWLVDQLTQWIDEEGLQDIKADQLEDFYPKLGLRQAGKNPRAVEVISYALRAEAGRYLRIKTGTYKPRKPKAETDHRRQPKAKTDKRRQPKAKTDKRRQPKAKTSQQQEAPTRPEGNSEVSQTALS